MEQKIKKKPGRKKINEDHKRALISFPPDLYNKIEAIRRFYNLPFTHTVLMIVSDAIEKDPFLKEKSQRDRHTET